MASELRVNTLKDASGNNSIATSFVARGPLKAWVNFNGTGTIAARDSLNLSSLTDNGTGEYTITYSSAWSAVDYAFTGTSGQTSGGSRTTGGIMFDDFSATVTTTSHRILSRKKDDASNVDCANQHCHTSGDLA